MSAADKRAAKAAVAKFLAGKDEVVLADVCAAVGDATGIRFSATTIAFYAKAEGFEKIPNQPSGWVKYRRV